MVQPLVRFQMHRIENFIDPLALGPVEVPVRVTVGLLPAARRHDVVDGIGEGRPKLNCGAAAGHLGCVAPAGSFACFGLVPFASATAFGDWQSGRRLVTVGSPARAKPVAVVQELEKTRHRFSSS